VSSINGQSGYPPQPNSGYPNGGYPNGGYPNGGIQAGNSPQMLVNYENANRPPYGYGGNRSVDTGDVVDAKVKTEEK